MLSVDRSLQPFPRVSFSTPQPHGRRMFTVSLLPSGPEPVPATTGRSFLRRCDTWPSTSQDRVSTSETRQIQAVCTNLPQTSPPAFRRFQVTSDADPPGLVPIIMLQLRNKNFPSNFFLPCCQKWIIFAKRLFIKGIECRQSFSLRQISSQEFVGSIIELNIDSIPGCGADEGRFSCPDRRSLCDVLAYGDRHNSQFFLVYSDRLYCTPD